MERSPEQRESYMTALESAITDLEDQLAERDRQLAEADEALIVYRGQSLLGYPESEEHYSTYTAALSRQQARRKAGEVG